MAKESTGIGLFEKWLSLWVTGGISMGILLGHQFPEAFYYLASLEYASVNFLVAILVWGMVYPMMINVDFTSLIHVKYRPSGLVITLLVNWLIKPFTMAALGLLFFEVVYVDIIRPENAEQYIAGLILLGAAPCTAMVFVWSQLTKGDATYTLVQVSLNDIIMVIAFAPIVAFLLDLTEINIPFETLLLSVFLYVVVPLTAGIITRFFLMSHSTTGTNDEYLAQFTSKIKPMSMVALLATVVLLFGFQGQIIIDKPILILLIAVPLLIQSYGIFFIGYGAAYIMKLPYNIAAPCALIGTSNFFELAVAVAISLFGLNSGAALATVVGVLVEVPVMLSLVAFSNKTRRYFN
jgi:ACR3 family arsenite transporter